MRIALGLAAIALCAVACGGGSQASPSTSPSLPASSSSSPQPPGTGPEIQLGTRFTMQPGAQALISGTKDRIMFYKVNNDSRCKPGQTCVWEGDAAVDFTVDGSPIRLHTSKRVGTPDATTQGYRVQLVAVSPDDKDVTIVVTKA